MKQRTGLGKGPRNADGAGKCFSFLKSATLCFPDFLPSLGIRSGSAAHSQLQGEKNARGRSERAGGLFHVRQTDAGRPGGQVGRRRC